MFFKNLAHITDSKTPKHTLETYLKFFPNQKAVFKAISSDLTTIEDSKLKLSGLLHLIQSPPQAMPPVFSTNISFLKFCYATYCAHLISQKVQSIDLVANTQLALSFLSEIVSFLDKKLSLTASALLMKCIFLAHLKQYQAICDLLKTAPWYNNYDQLQALDPSQFIRFLELFVLASTSLNQADALVRCGNMLGTKILSNTSPFDVLVQLLFRLSEPTTVCSSDPKALAMLSCLFAWAKQQCEETLQLSEAEKKRARLITLASKIFQAIQLCDENTIALFKATADLSPELQNTEESRFITAALTCYEWSLQKRSDGQKADYALNQKEHTTPLLHP